MLTRCESPPLPLSSGRELSLSPALLTTAASPPLQTRHPCLCSQGAELYGKVLRVNAAKPMKHKLGAHTAGEFRPPFIHSHRCVARLFRSCTNTPALVVAAALAAALASPSRTDEGCYAISTTVCIKTLSLASVASTAVRLGVQAFLRGRMCGGLGAFGVLSGLLV